MLHEDKRSKILGRLKTMNHYREAGGLLGDCITIDGPAQSVLNALSLEIGIKALLLHDGVSKRVSHDTKKGWGLLRNETKERILIYANDDMAGHVDYSNIEDVLTDVSKVFLEYRYEFEMYEDQTKHDQGYRMHPNEVSGLIYAIGKFLTETYQINDA